MDGQLLPAERKLLHDIVKAGKPKLALEVGTWRGGGSTMQIVKALEEIGDGMLYTCEPDPECFSIAAAGWKSNRFVQVANMTSDRLIAVLLNSNRVPDFIFFDGPEDEDTALRDLQTLEPVLAKGAIFMMHDWDQPSKKSVKIRPYIEQSKLWEGLVCLTKPDSVGICCYRKT